MPEYLIKDVLRPASYKVLNPWSRTRVMVDTDREDPEAIVGDEVYGEPTELEPPEDPEDEIPIEAPNLLYCNRNPRGEPCPECRRLVGTVWEPGSQPRVPRHDGCYCYYQLTWSPPDKRKRRFRHAPRNQAAAEEKLI